MIRAAALSVLLALGLPAQAQQEGISSGRGAVLRSLDKLNGAIEDVEIFSGGGREVMGLEVELGDCRFPAENPTGDAYAFLTIREVGDPKVIFRGWMIASAPALNALDHSRYDIWVLRCITS